MTPMMELRPTQKKAVETIDRNVCVSAGAGTGKTRVLVERFLYLVEQKSVHPQEILAITFTDKAAQEMKARIATGLRERGLEEARRELENAYIGTIHSFCARILREHPIEAGVDPDFRVLEEEEAELLKERVLDELIESRFQEAAAFELLHVYSEDGIREAIKQGASRVHAFGTSLSEIRSSKLGSVVDGAVREKLKAKVLEALRPLQALKGKEENCAEVERALEKTISSWDELEALKEPGGRFRRHKSMPQIGFFKDLFEEWVSYCREVLAQPVKEAFLDLACDFETRYRALKREESGLDFNDLEREAVRLLSGKEARNEACRSLYQNQFKFVMVDEFQDTSPIQDRLISFISRSDNLFIVGDWKQSIYGFRGAEASLLLEKEKFFLEGGLGEKISLVENFRSRSELLEFINPFFEQLWATEGRSFEPLEAPQLVRAGGPEEMPRPPQERGTGSPSTPPRGNGERKNPSVEFLTIERDENENMAEVRMKEARVLAERIRDMVQEGDYCYKDFAMLFRAGTNIYFYEHELRNLGIPYYVISGRGFYRQHEIRDMISFLECLDNPHLDIPLAAVLRSPLVQVSDDTLFWLAQASKRVNSNVALFQAFLKSDEISEIRGEDRERLQLFRGLFFELLEQKGRWTISECLEWILERTQYDRYVLSLPHGKRHFANLRKLLELAREVESRNPIHLGDFIRYVKGLETQEVRESEAQVEALEGDVVKLMTIHKAKGLEFKVVVIPDLNRSGEKRRSRFLIDPEWGLGLKVRNEATGEFEETLTFRRVKEKMIQNLRGESKRLLYVGMTRAQDHLIFSGSLKENGEEPEASGFDDGANWYEWVNQWWSHQSKAAFERQVIQVSRKRLGRRPLALAERKKIRNLLESAQPVKIRAQESMEPILQAIQPIPAVHFERIDLPVTAYAVFEQNPDDYRRTYEMGALPEEELKPEEWPEDEDEQAMGAADFGTVIHKIFEHLVRSPHEAEKRLPFWLERFQAGLDEKSTLEVKALSERFLLSDQFSDIRSAKARYPEIPFVLRLRSGIIQGTLDLLYQRQDRAWVILDYKTSRLEPSLLGTDELAAYAERYRSQLMLYALACSELLNISVERAAIYFARLDSTYDFSLEGLDFKKLKEHFEALQMAIIEKRKGW